MATFLEHGHVRDNVYVTLSYEVDDTGNVTCTLLTKTQLAAFTPYVHEQMKHASHGNSLREATTEEAELWQEFVDTLLICSKCGQTPVLWNPFISQWLCIEHQTGLELEEEENDERI